MFSKIKVVDYTDRAVTSLTTRLSSIIYVTTLRQTNFLRMKFLLTLDVTA